VSNAVEGGGAVGGLHQRHQLADEDRDQGVDQRHAQAGGQHREVQAACLADEVPVEREQAWRRCAGRRRGRVDAGFEEGEHGAAFSPCWRSGVAVLRRGAALDQARIRPGSGHDKES